MPLTPQEVASKVFGPTRMRRGYDENEVDAFLDAVEAELTRLNAENERLRAELKLAGRAVPEADSVEDPAPAAADTVATPPPAPVAEPVVAAAPEPAPAPSEPVEQQVTRMLVLAQQTADAAISEAQSDADRTRGAARIEAERVLAEARARAAEEIGIMERSKASLETQVEQLQTFEREYRQRLRAYLSMQLSELDGASIAPPAVEMSKAHVLDVADAGEPARPAFHESDGGAHGSHTGEAHNGDAHDGGSNGSGSHDTGAHESGSGPDSGSSEPIETPSLAGGLLDPPGFGAVWSPDGGASQPGADPFIGGPRDPEGHSSYISHAFDLGGDDGLRSGGYGPIS